MSELTEFKEELAALLKKHNVAIVGKSLIDNDLSINIGFQFNYTRNYWSDRHHLTDYDLGPNPK